MEENAGRGVDGMNAAKMMLTDEHVPLLDYPIHISRVQEAFYIPQHEHDFVEINIVLEGSGFHYIEDQLLRVGKGDLFVLPPGVSHVYRPVSSEKPGSFIVYNVNFRPELFECHPFFNRVGLQEELIGISPEKHRWQHVQDLDGSLLFMLRGMYEEFREQRNGYQVMIAAELVQLLIRISRQLGDKHQECRSTMPIERLLEEVRSNPGDSQFTLGGLAGRYGLSRSQFHRIFTKATDQSFIKYVQTARIDKACELLRSSDYKISHIAGMVGYEDLKFFHGLFKKKIGITPNQYRKRGLTLPS